MVYFPTHLDRWTLPDNYHGAVWPNWYLSGIGQNRDSNTLTRSNFMVALQRLGGESETVKIIREGHWAVGWVEWIAIHESDEKALRVADEMQKDLQDYPVLSEDHWTELEWNEMQEAWQNMSISERLEMIKLSNVEGVSRFAARHPWIPDNSGGLDETMRDYVN